MSTITRFWGAVWADSQEWKFPGRYVNLFSMPFLHILISWFPRSAVIAIIAACLHSVWAEPVVITGKMVPGILGARIDRIRLTNLSGEAIPFQIDEVTEVGEYICDQGEDPNSDKSNGLIDIDDEIVFLWNDADANLQTSGKSKGAISITIRRGLETRGVLIHNDPSISLSTVSYIDYRHDRELIETPWFYAQFGHERFHFTRAGVRPPGEVGYIDLTHELRIWIYLRALWGLLPIEFDEENLVCLVKRYKVGPIRLIRRGDFHLKLGFLKGSHAAVNQICYPQVVCVPVYVNLPFRFGNFFKDAFIEMTPVISSKGFPFSFTVPEHLVTMSLGSAEPVDTLIPILPNNGFMSVHNGSSGYGWVLQTNMPDSLLSGSGYLFSRPSERSGIAHCGFRLSIDDLPSGDYLITNWVVFSSDGPAGLLDAAQGVENRARITIDNGRSYTNRFTRIRTLVK